MVLAARTLTHEVCMSIEETKKAVLLRVARIPTFAVVPEHAIKLFDRVIEETEADAYREHPEDRWARVQFWKEEILSRVAPTLRGLVAVQFHEYIAALDRGNDSDPYGFDNVPPYGGEPRAQHDAYMACCASLA